MTYTFESAGFFGYGEKGDFKYWSFAHFAPLILLAVGIFLIIWYRKKIANMKKEGTLRFVIGFIMLMSEMTYFWRLIYVGGTYVTKLPLQFCQWSGILCAFLIMSKNKTLYDICYFMVLTGGLFPLVMPAVITTTGPAYFRYYQFWCEHCIPILIIMYMTFVHGYRPHWKSMLWSVGFVALLAAFAIWANATIPGAHYLYLSGTQPGASILDILPASMWLRLPIFGAILAVMYILAYMPFFIPDMIKKRKAKKAVTEGPAETENKTE